MTAVAAATKRSTWIVAVSIGEIEALKDQGFARWTYTFRSLHQHAKTNLLSSSSSGTTPAKLFRAATPATSASTASEFSGKIMIRPEMKEESLNKVMNLSCWGPNTIRF
ncbi:uncharacterized protein LOC142167378 [Nicotiana tabacum]|uniref:Uncharacterized protein LOC142167378 n=1 Tax=Nicotiana tabacum TaxID=4097 RepID=A0AC58SFA8_TOBAC